MKNYKNVYAMSEKKILTQLFLDLQIQRNCEKQSNS